MDGALVAAAVEPTALPPEVEAILPERMRGYSVTQVAVSTQRTEAPVPAVVMDNDDKLTDETGEIIVAKNVDLLRDPVPEERLRKALAAIGEEHRLQERLDALARRRAEKEAAVEAYEAGEVTQ